MYCVTCGQDIDDNATFCPHCGAPQTVAEIVKQPEPPAEPELEATAEPEPETVCQAGDQQTGYQRTGYQQNGYQQTGYQQNGYQQTGYQQANYQQAPPAAAAKPSDTKAIVALCCGVFSLITLFTGWGSLLGIIAAIVGLVIGVKARKENPSTMATVGVILCACGLVICALFFLACVACVGGVTLLSTMSY